MLDVQNLNHSSWNRIWMDIKLKRGSHTIYIWNWLGLGWPSRLPCNIFFLYVELVNQLGLTHFPVAKNMSQDPQGGREETLYGGGWAAATGERKLKTWKLTHILFSLIPFFRILHHSPATFPCKQFPNLFLNLCSCTRGSTQTTSTSQDGEGAREQTVQVLEEKVSS